MIRVIKKKLKSIAENMPLVYEAGYDKGNAEGGDTRELVSQFTETIQNRASGNTGVSYNYAFFQSPFNEKTFADIMSSWDKSKTIIRADFMFSQAQNIGEGLYTDKLDFSNARTTREAFSNSGVTKLKVIDVRKTEGGFNGMANLFSDCLNLVSIDEFYPSTATDFVGTFNKCYELKEVIFKSEIAVNGLHLGFSSSLNKESLESVVNQLSSNTSGLTVTLPLVAVNNLFDGGRDGTEWQDLIATKPNWTFAYYERI